MSGPQFFQTGYGRTFFSAQLPRLIRALESIASELMQQRKTRHCGTWGCMLPVGFDSEFGEGPVCMVCEQDLRPSAPPSSSLVAMREAADALDAYCDDHNSSSPTDPTVVLPLLRDAISAEEAQQAADDWTREAREIRAAELREDAAAEYRDIVRGADR